MDPETRESLIARLPNPAGQPQRVVETSRPAVDPRSPNLTPEEKLGVFVYINESAIRQKQTALFKAEDVKAKAEALRELRSLYTTRFEIDTAYQDFRVREIESRAKKLRDEVNARDNASRDWVGAMVTLAKMRADGIETMDSLATPSLPIQRSAFSTSGLSSPINPGVPSPDNFKPNSFGQPNTQPTYLEFQRVPLPAPDNRNPSSRGARPLNARPSDQYRN